MRISCIQNDPGYQEWTNILSKGKNVDVFLNGILMDNVVMADDQKDEIICHALPLRVDSGTDELALETYYGRVSIEIVDPVPVPDTFQLKFVQGADFQDDPGDCDMLPSDVFCFRDYQGYIISHIVIDEWSGLPEVPSFEVEIDLSDNSESVDILSRYHTEKLNWLEPDGTINVESIAAWYARCSDFGPAFIEEPDDFVIFDEFF